MDKVDVFINFVSDAWSLALNWANGSVEEKLDDTSIEPAHVVAFIGCGIAFISGVALIQCIIGFELMVMLHKLYVLKNRPSAIFNFLGLVAATLTGSVVIYMFVMFFFGTFFSDSPLHQALRTEEATSNA